jgi:hypothetical protein
MMMGKIVKLEFPGTKLGMIQRKPFPRAIDSKEIIRMHLELRMLHGMHISKSRQIKPKYQATGWYWINRRNCAALTQQAKTGRKGGLIIDWLG